MEGEEPQGDSEPGSKMSQNGRTRFGLLWHHEVEALKPLLRLITGGIDPLFDHWYAAYATCFDHTPGLSKPEFVAVFKPHLGESISALAAGRMVDCGAPISRLGAVLAQRKVPFDQVLLLLRMYEDSVLAVFPQYLQSFDLFRIFSKLTHALLAVLAESYFRASSAGLGERVGNPHTAKPVPVGDTGGPGNAIIGSSSAMCRLREHIKAAAQVRGTVLLVGESGTGKELVANAIHHSALAPDTPFIAVNCAAIPRDLIESELFGYQRGAFSGANAHFLGLFRSAEKGTLFLDEVTEMSPETQSKLLRAIQERTVRPLGSTREIPIDVRLIASTNRDPEEAVRSGHLRQDLYYRLQASVLRISPLREPLEDIPLLVEHFINLLNSKLGRAVPVKGIEGQALRAMLDYPWPGNVRELSNAIETAMTFGRRPLIGIEDLPPAVVRGDTSSLAGGAPTEPAEYRPRPTLHSIDNLGSQRARTGGQSADHHWRKQEPCGKAAPNLAQKALLSDQ